MFIKRGDIRRPQKYDVVIRYLRARYHGKESASSVGDLGWEDPLKKGMATHSSILACGIPWTEEPGWL